MNKAERVSTSNYPHIPSLLVQSLPFYQQLFHACTSSPYSSILQLLTFLLLGPSVSFTYFLYKIFTFFSLHITKPPHSISLHPFHHTTLHSICTRSHATTFIYAFIALILPSCHATCSSQITNFHSTHIWLLCLSSLSLSLPPWTYFFPS